MLCPECEQTLTILKQRIWDFTTTAFGCPRTGHWPGYTARVYIDNVELLKCGCGVAPNVPHLEELQRLLFGDAPSTENVNAGDLPIDPFSSTIYMGTWDDDDEGWILSQHQEH